MRLIRRRRSTAFANIFYTNFSRRGHCRPPPAVRTRPRQRTARHGQNRPPLQLPQRPATQASAQVLSFLRRKVATLAGRTASQGRDWGGRPVGGLVFLVSSKVQRARLLAESQFQV